MERKECNQDRDETALRTAVYVHIQMKTDQCNIPPPLSPKEILICCKVGHLKAHNHGLVV